MTKEEQLRIINDTIKKTKYNLKPLGYNLVFWGVLIITMSLFHYFFPQIVQLTYYSSLIYWVAIPLFGMVYTTYYNINSGKNWDMKRNLEESLELYGRFLDCLGFQ